MVGVDELGEDITTGVIVEELTPCPKVCPGLSELIAIPGEIEVPGGTGRTEGPGGVKQEE